MGKASWRYAVKLKSSDTENLTTKELRLEAERTSQGSFRTPDSSRAMTARNVAFLRTRPGHPHSTYPYHHHVRRARAQG